MCYPLAASSGVQRSRRDDDAPGGEWEVDLRLGGDGGDGAGDDSGSGGVLIWNLVEGQIVIGFGRDRDYAVAPPRSLL